MSTASTVMLFPLLFFLFILMIPVMVGVYVFRDARGRGMNAALWTVVAILAPAFIGFIIYLLVRGNYSNLKCPVCGAAVTGQYVVCPRCGVKLRPACPGCAMPVEPDWKLCPKCTQPLPEQQPDITPPVQPRDKTLWKVLLILLLIPVLLTSLLAVSFSGITGGSVGYREISIDEYFDFHASGEGSPEISETVAAWLEEQQATLNMDEAAALVYQYEAGDIDGYYYLLYLPRGGGSPRRSIGQSTGMFGTTVKLEVEDTSNSGSLYCISSSARRQPKLKVMCGGEWLDCDVTAVDFNPTVYVIEPGQDYEAVPGSIEIEAEEREISSPE